MSKAISLERIKGLISEESTGKSKERQEDIRRMILKVKNSLESADKDSLMADNPDVLL